jgi:uncharacterized YkwD family protein/spore coat assembly protein SafA
MLRKMIASLICAAILTAPATAKVQAADTDTYTVKPGDSMWIISVKYRIGLSEIIAANPQIRNPRLIYPGNKITVPLQTAVKSIESQVIKLVNQQRAAQGIKPLKANWQLSRVARFKSQDMKTRNYFTHTSPAYGSPFDMMKAFGISFSTAGENIAAGQATAQEVMKSWMNSPGHRKNILSASFTEIGVGYVSGGSYRHYWTQMFIKP